MVNHLVSNKIISQKHQGGLKRRSITIATLDLYQKLFNLNEKNITGALIAMDESAAFDIVDHTIL